MDDSNYSLEDDPVGEILFDCLQRDDRDQALNEVCAAHPQYTAELRRRLHLLAKCGMLKEGENDVPEPSTSLGPFRFLRRLGSGATGIVWLAEQIHLGRQVALKVLRGGVLSSARARLRFQIEAQTIASLDHPGICPVHEVGESDGIPWMAMRFVEGRALDAVLDEARAADRSSLHLHAEGESASTVAEPHDSILALVEKLARAAEVAHEAGFVHRDLKPANVMVSTDGEPVILDFGLAHRTASEGQRLTMSGDLVGTPVYMAPEQVGGSECVVDRRTDVWALGVLLYECLTLRLPFEAVNRESLYRQILFDEFADPGRRLDRDLRVILGTCLAKEPERRYPTALALADDLRRLRDHEPIRARRAGLVLRTRRWTRRNPVLAACLGALTLALLVAAVALINLDASLRESRAHLLASTAAAVAQNETLVAGLLARESIRTTPTPQGFGRLYEILGRLHERVQYPHPGQVGSVRFCLDDTHLLTAGVDGNAMLWALGGTHVRTFQGHSAPIWALEVSPEDSTRFVTGSIDGKAILWSTMSDQPISILKSPSRPSGQVRNAVFKQDGSIITAHRDEILIWNRDGKEPTVVQSGGALVTDIALSPDGIRLVATKSDGSAKLINLDTNGAVALEGHRRPAWHARFSPDGEFFVTASGDKGPYGLNMPRDRSCEAILWDRDGRRVKKLTDERNSIFSIDCSREHVLTATEAGRISVWQRNGELLQTFRLGELHVWSARFIANGSKILNSNGKEIFVTTLEGDVLLRIRAHSGMVSDLRLSANEEQIASAAWDGTARLFDVRHRPFPAARVGSGLLNRVLVTNSGRRFACLLPDATIGIHDMNGELFARTENADPIRWVAYSPDGRWLAGACFTGRVDVWELRGGRDFVPHSTFEVEPSGEQFVFAADSRSILVESPPGFVRVFDLEGMAIAEWQASRAGRQDRELSGIDSTNKGRVATVDKSGAVRLWKLENRTAIQVEHWPLPRPAGPRTGSLRFTPDGSEIIVSLGARTFWRIDMGHDDVVPVEVPRGHAFRVAIAPDGDLFAICGTQLVHLYDPREGTFTTSFAAHDHVVTDVALTRERKLLTISNDGICRIWPTNRSKLVRDADDYLYRTFTPEERRRYAHLLGR